MDTAYETVTLLNAVTATTTSEPLNVEKFKRIGFQFTRADHSAGSSKFEVQGTIDGTNWVTIVTLISNVANDNSETITRVADVTLSSNTSAIAWLDNFVGLVAVRVKVTETTDGTHSASAIASK